MSDTTTTPTVEPTDVLNTANAEAPSTEAPKVETPATPAKPAVTPKAVIVTPVKPAVAPKAAEPVAEDSPAVKYMKDYIARYLEINNGDLSFEAKKKQAIDGFKRICNHAIANADKPEVLDLVLAFFKENRTKVLSEEVALQGIPAFNKTDQMRISVFYRLFFDYSNPERRKKSQANMDQVRSIFGSDHLVNYISRKFSK